MKYLIGILLLACSLASFAQNAEKPLVQFSGIIYNADNSSVVPYATVTNVTTGKEVGAANYEGYFSFVAHEEDSLKFTSVGYFPTTVVIPKDITKKSLIVEIRMRAQVVNLPMVRIFPWATTDEFRHDFLAMKVADDDLEIARKNLSATSVSNLKRTLPLSGYESFNAQDKHNAVVNSHSFTNPLLNPFAWGSLIRDIAEGDKARKESN
ncbi:hypothetical protein ACFQZS_19120 [Mucilaginibacter calamicampi]|uniref:Carboxypeptidase-like regulatory domain-containing protein n=1 Tax=Mucilaginibacter calamicampi TaxID=1302352 RepID=A0ABW2Z383_9SPHI